MSDVFHKQIELGTCDIVRMAQDFYGYGRWDAPYWFIGPEAGMGKDGKDNLVARYDSWKQLGCAPVVDCEKHHRGFGFTKWHDTTDMAATDSLAFRVSRGRTESR